MQRYYTERDPLGSTMHALATIPLIKELHCDVVMLDKCAKKMMLLRLEKFARLHEWWTSWPQKVLNLAIFPAPPKLG